LPSGAAWQLYVPLAGFFSPFLPAFPQPPCPWVAENQDISKVASAGLFGGGTYKAMLLGWWVGRSCFLPVYFLWITPLGGERGMGNPTVTFGADLSS